MSRVSQQKSIHNFMTWLCFISSVTAAVVHGHQSLEHQSGGINMTFNLKFSSVCIAERR